MVTENKLLCPEHVPALYHNIPKWYPSVYLINWFWDENLCSFDIMNNHDEPISNIPLFHQDQKELQHVILHSVIKIFSVLQLYDQGCKNVYFLGKLNSSKPNFLQLIICFYAQELGESSFQFPKFPLNTKISLQWASLFHISPSPGVYSY